MAKIFTYKAKDCNGQELSGSIVAADEAAVAAYIRNRGYFVARIHEARPTGRERLRNLFIRPVGAKDLAVFCRQFATLTDAGLSLNVALGILIEQSPNPRVKAAAQDLLHKVQEGEPLSQAMRLHPQVFPDLMVSMVEAGEVGGVMDTVMSRLAKTFEKEYRLNQRIKAAMTYPAAVLVIAAITMGVIVTVVLPTFVPIFAQMNVQLPVPTRLLLALSDLLCTYGLLIAGAALAGIYGLTVYCRRPAAREKLDQVILRLPIFGNLWQMIAIARFTRTFSTLLRGGVPIITALEAVKNTTANQLLIKALTAAQVSVREGAELSAPLAASGLFPPMVVQMVAVGEETGALDKMLDKVADFYDSDVDDIVGRLSSIIEPLLILVLGVVIGGIILSVMWPIVDVVTNLNTVM